MGTMSFKGTSCRPMSITSMSTAKKTNKSKKKGKKGKEYRKIEEDFERERDEL